MVAENKCYEESKRERTMKENTVITINAEEQADSFRLEDGIRDLFTFGRILGIFPYRNAKLYFVPGIVTMLLLFCTLVFEVFKAIPAPKRNAVEIVNAIEQTLFNGWGWLIYLYFICRWSSFRKIFEAFNVHTQLDFKDKTLRRDTILMIVIVMTSAVLENLVLHLNYFKEFTSINGNEVKPTEINKTTFEVYFQRAHPGINELTGFNTALAVGAFIRHKILLYSWNFLDIVITVFARAIYFRFSSLNQSCFDQIRKFVAIQDNKQILDADFSPAEHWIWRKALSDHVALTKLVGKMDEFFSPLVFGSYTMNMFFICLKVFEGLTIDHANRSLVHSIYFPWSFIHLVARVLLISITCSRINTSAHKFRLVLQECPSHFYTTEVSRWDMRLQCGPEIGLTGFGCFTITKPFILSLWSVIFTFEIILLQCAPTAAV